MGKMGGIENAYEITDARITFISLVDKAANRKRFLIMKGDGGKAGFTTCGRIIKADEGSHFVTGIVYEPMEEDTHGNYMTEEEVAKACYWFSEHGDKVDLQHSFEPLEKCKVVESWVAKADFSLNGEPVKKGTWLMTIKVDDPSVWKKIKDGDITGLSMGGVGMYSSKDTDIGKSSEGANGMKGNGISKSDSGDGKGISQDSIDALKGIATSMLQLLEAISGGSGGGKKEQPIGDGGKEKDDIEDCGGSCSDEKKVKKEAGDMDEKDIERAVMEAIEKAKGRTKTISYKDLVGDDGDDDEVDEKEIEKMVEKAVEKAMDIVAEQEEEFEREQEEREMIADIVQKAVGEAIEPLMKSRGVPTNMGYTYGAAVEKQEGKQHYLHGIL